MVEINKIISSYVSTDYISSINGNDSRNFNISEINFEVLQKEFEKSKTKNLLLQNIEEVIEQRLKSMPDTNPTRINFYNRFQQIIKAYNTDIDRASIEKTFNDLINLAKDMTTEEKRYIREGFTNEEELALYDILFKNNLSKSEIKKLKAVASTLLEKIKLKINETNNWVEKEETRALVKNNIRAMLYNELPKSYNDENSITNYTQNIYEYLYTKYKKAA